MSKSVKIAVLYNSTQPSRIFSAVCSDAVTGRELGRKLFVSALACERPTITLGDLAEMIANVREPSFVRLEVQCCGVQNTIDETTKATSKGPVQKRELIDLRTLAPARTKTRRANHMDGSRA